MAAVDIPSHMRPVPGSINITPACLSSLPPQSTSTLTPHAVATALVTAINSHLSSRNHAALSSLFVPTGFWRDHLALTWEFRTAHTPKAIAELLAHAASSKHGFRLTKVELDESNEARKPQISILQGGSTGGDVPADVKCVQFVLQLDTVIGRGLGLVKAIEADGQWRIYTLYTSLRELKGHEELIGDHRIKGVEHGGKPGRKNWAERRAAEENFEDGAEPAVFVLGGGQAGLTIAARLKMVGISTLLIDQNDRVGDNWRKRYHQLVLHDPVWYDHLPYMNFPPQWPIFTPKDKLAQFFEAYATLLELNVWTKTTLESAKWDDATAKWTVVVNRTLPDGSVQKRTFHPRHVIQATGHSGKKNMPDIKGIDTFGGSLYHSSDFRGASPNGAGKRAVVVGSCNSGHDIAQDFVEKGYHVTIVQRSTTHVVSSKAITDISLKGLFSEDGPQVDDADLFLHGLPTPVLKAIQVRICERQAEMDKEMLDGLANAGFKTDSGPDGAGLFIKYFQRGGGYYIDVGAAALIADGRIKVKQGQEISELTKNGIKFADGSSLEADEIVFATGYQNMRSQTRITFGDEVADRVSDVWGFNKEGEMRTMWQRTGHPGFWFHGGNLAICRYFSRFLALQILALESGVSAQGEL